MTDLRRTPLFDAHEAAGARLVPFAGWEMPVQYEGVGPEHLAVRSSCGVFDVSHMGEVETSGPGAADLLQRLLSNDVSKIDVGGAQYSVLCREDGGVLDDLFTYRLGDDRFLTVTNASNHERDFAWFSEHAGGIRLRGRRTSSPTGRCSPFRGRRLAASSRGLHRASCRRAFGQRRSRWPARECLVCGTGYTGEDGVEILCPPDHARALWDAVVEAGATPAGLGARDTLRMEVCFHLYGNDLSEDRNPIEAGLGWCCKEETGFIGSEKIAEARASGTAEKLAPFVLPERGIARQGNPLIDIDGETVGMVTSGTHSPSLGQGIGMAYVRADLTEPGTALEIDVRGKHRAARIESRPLYDPNA